MYKVELSKKTQRKVKKLDKVSIGIFLTIISKLEDDPFQRSLKTHKLSGELAGYYSCSLNYSNRIIFIIILDNNIIITDIGSHDDVY